ncbi:MAG: iscS-B [Parachlamydiales bacterium]|nr:iscS-B [Parachlamydiales bacterium]
MARLYLDNNATTALDPRVFKAMIAEFSGPPANPSSIHYFGQQAKSLLNTARRSIASFFGAKPEELIFTSGGTEGINMLIRGSFGGRSKGHLITTSIEHASVYKTVQSLENSGVSVTYLPVDAWGAPLPEQLEAAILPHTSAIVLSAANGETGVKLDIEKIASIAHQREIPLILDAVAYIGKEPLPMPPGVSAIAFSGHKFHAPKGIGGVIARSSLKLTPLLTGGGQEYQRRAGTENLAGILGLAEAIQILKEKQTDITHHLQDLRNHLEISLIREFPDITINGAGPRIANTSNLAFPGIDGETLLIHLDMAGVAVSHGSACSSGALEPSRVLLQMGMSRSIARSSLRFSVSRMNTREEIDACIERLTEVVRKIRK